MTITEPVTIPESKQSTTGRLIAASAQVNPATEYSVVALPVNTSFLSPANQLDESERIRLAINVLNAQRVPLGKDVVGTALNALQKHMAKVVKRATPHQRKQATVLFADVSGFTALSESLDAEDVHTIMNELWDLLDFAIHSRSGTIDKHIGDAVMALFGEPEARENDPEFAIRAALDMQQGLAEYNEKLWQKGFQNANLQIRIGINTGPVFMGNVGTIGEYTARGDTVNLASCLESAAPIGGILISQSTHIHVAGMFVTKPQAPLYVKGKIEPIRTYVVEEAKANAYLVPSRNLQQSIKDELIITSAQAYFDEPERIHQAIDALNAQRVLLGDDVVDTVLIVLQKYMAKVVEHAIPHQRKQATVLFADVSGFTAFSESLDAEDVHTITNVLWERLDLAIHSRSGTIDKHIGDAVMALFGAPVAQENDPELAVRAALDMQQGLAEFNERLWEMGFPDANLQMRIGINTGPVLVGEVGTIGEYTAMGDTVNLASRLESAAPIGGILISQNTYIHITGMFVTDSQAPLYVKGKIEPIRTYVVSEAKASAYLVPNRGLEGITTRMIGRNHELAQLQDAYDQMLECKHFYFASVVGEAGVGKSRMMDEFGKWLAQQPTNHTIFHGRATLELLGQPYALMRNVFMSQLGIRDSDSVASVRLTLEREIVKIMGEAGREQAHFIGHLMGFNFSDSPYIRGILNDVKQIRDRAFHSIAQLLHKQTESTPIVLMLEDVHWADTGSLEMLDYLARECSNIPLLIVAPMRATLIDRWPQWGKNHKRPVSVTLNPLSEESSNDLINEILRKMPDIPHALRELIIVNAEGNPFYIEELIKVLIEDGVIVVGPRRWHVQAQLLQQVKIPPTLTALLQARLDRLPPIERIVLQQAAVVGRIFWKGAVEKLSADESDLKDGEDGNLDNLMLYTESLRTKPAYSQTLDILCSKGLIYPRDTSAFSREKEYIFSHAILHQVVYESVLKRQRPTYHRQAANWLIDRIGENAGQYAARIAVHFEQAKACKLATYWYGRAANQARETYTPETAIEYYEKALSFYSKKADGQGYPSRSDRYSHNGPQKMVIPLDPSSRDQQITLYEGLGEMLRWQVRYEDAEKVYQEMCQLARVNKNLIAEAHAWNGLSVVQDRQSNHQSGLKSAQEAYQLAQHAKDGIEEVTALLYKGGANHRLGNNDEALRLGQLSLKLSQNLSDKRSIARSHNLLSLTHMIFGDYEVAQENLEASIQLFQELGDRRSVALLINNLGKAASLRGDYVAAANFFQDALLIAREIGDRDTATLNLLNLGAAQNDQGECQKAEDNLRQVIQRTENGEWFGLPFAYSVLAEALMGQDKLSDAFEMADKSLRLAQKTGLKEQIGLSWLVLGQISFRMLQGHYETEELDRRDVQRDVKREKPDVYFSQSLHIFSSIGAEGEKARTLWAWSKYEDAYGDKIRAQVMHSQAEKIFKELKLQPT